MAMGNGMGVGDETVRVLMKARRRWAGDVTHAHQGGGGRGRQRMRRRRRQHAGTGFGDGDDDGDDDECRCTRIGWGVLTGMPVGVWWVA